jgi:hypothetical protein
MVETPSSSESLLRQHPFSATILVTCRTLTTLHVLQIINFGGGLDLFQPGLPLKRVGFVGSISAQPIYLVLYNIYYIMILCLFKKKEKNSKIISKELRLSQIFFLPILHKIGLYIYTIKYKSSIKILCFLQKISKKFQNNFFKKC